MILPKGFKKFVFTPMKGFTIETLLKKGYVVCPKTGIFYNPKTGPFFQNTVNGCLDQSVFCECESNSKFHKTRFLVEGSQETTEINTIDFIWEIMTGEEPIGELRLKPELTKYQLQWANIEIESPLPKMLKGLSENLESIYKSNLVFKSQKGRSRFYKRSKVILDELKNVIGESPKKFISGVDFLSQMNEDCNSRKIRRSEGLNLNP